MLLHEKSLREEYSGVKDNDQQLKRAIVQLMSGDSNRVDGMALPQQNIQ